MALNHVFLRLSSLRPRLRAIFAIVTCATQFAIITIAAGATALEYKVDFSGVSGSLADSIKAVSRLVSGKDKPPAGFAGLRQRADADQKTAIAVLRAEGFYDGTVSIAIDEDKQPAVVKVDITPGVRYPISECTIRYTRQPPVKAPKVCLRIGIRKGQPARADDILAAETKLIQILLQNGRPDAKVKKRTAIVDHGTHTMRLTWEVDPGRAARFGEVRVSGVKRTKPAFLERIVPWKAGAEYDVRKLDEYRQRLADLDLFDLLSVTPDTAQENMAGDAPILVKVRERAPHSFGGGLTYATDEGPGATAFWERRNWWGKAETLRFDLALATIEKSFAATLTLPHQPNTGQTLTFSGKALNENTDAYRKTGFVSVAQLSTPLGGKWLGKFGVSFEAAQISQENTAPFSLLFSLPSDVSYDSTNSLLDPTKGERLAIHVEPVFGNSDGLVGFLILHSEGSAYRALDKRRHWVAAARFKVGSILLSGYDAIPADMRFYAGGGGSVRGYDYQAIGPHDAEGNPLGGRSVAETSFEMRYRISNSFGAVAFVDAGTVARSPFFADAVTPQLGAGVGVRYYTSLGPIRLDVAAPINRSSGHSVFKIYVSLGQAF